MYHCGYPSYQATSCKCFEETLRAEVGEMRDRLRKAEADLALLRSEVKAAEKLRNDYIVWNRMALDTLKELEEALILLAFEPGQRQIRHADVLRMSQAAKALRTMLRSGCPIKRARIES